MRVTINMKLALCLLTIHIGYILAKAVNVPCQNHSVNLRIVRSDEAVTMKPEKIYKSPGNLSENGLMSPIHDNKLEKVPKVASNFNEDQVKQHQLNNNPEKLVKWPTNTNKIDDKSKVNSIPVTYQAIDPKNIFIYGLYPPKPNKSAKNNDRTAVNLKVNKIFADDIDFNKDREIQNNDTIKSQFKTADWSSDVTNIRELRADLLNHLLDYFLNIIKEENNQNVTRKKNNKDVLRVEKKLRNYYGPQIDDLDLGDDDYDDDIDYDFENDDYRRKSVDGTEIALNEKVTIDEKNATKVESEEMLQNDTKIVNFPLPWQPVIKDTDIAEVTNKTIMIPIIENYEESMEIVESKKHTNLEKNDTIFETTTKSLANLDDLPTTTDKNDILLVVEPSIDVVENITNDFIYVNEDNEDQENVYYEDFPDSNDYSSIENDTIISIIVNKTKTNENITDFTTERQTDHEIATEKTLNDDLDVNSDNKLDKTIKAIAKVTPLEQESAKNDQLSENVVILTSPVSDDEDLAIKVNRKELKSNKSQKSSKKQKKGRKNSTRWTKSFVLNLNITLL